MKEVEDETLRLNYNLSFNAMRGYHTSELFHKRDAIIILNSFLVCTIAVYAAILKFLNYDAISKDSTILLNVSMISLIISIFISISLRVIFNRYKEKIQKENIRYEQYRNECIICRERLGMNTMYKKHSLNKKDTFYWETMERNPASPRKGTGFEGAIRIINAYSIILAIFSWLITISIFLFTFIPREVLDILKTYVRLY